jgi:O-acetyl-ADP-ribose deacetylase (regulator of RNase III)
MELATQHDIRTLAFPGISTGVYGYPVELAAAIALAEVRTYTVAQQSLREIIFCCFSQNDLLLYETLLREDA